MRFKTYHGEGGTGGGGWKLRNRISGVRKTWHRCFEEEFRRESGVRHVFFSVWLRLRLLGRLSFAVDRFTRV